MKGIIINADDFGPSGFINRGIIRAIENDLVNSVSAIVTFGEDSHENIYELHKSYGNSVAIGLHLALTAGWPVHRPLSEVSSLCPNISRSGEHYFWSFNKIKLHKIKMEEVELELNAQIKLLGKILGGTDKIDHVNVHHNILNFYDPFWNKVRQLLEYYKLPYRNPLSSKHKKKLSRQGVLPIEKYALKEGWRTMMKNTNSLYQLLKGTQGNHLRKVENEAIISGVPLPSYYISEYYGQPGVHHIEAILKAINDGETAEFMLHLGHEIDPGENLWGIDKKYYPMREQELYHLENSGLNDLMKQYGVSKTFYPKYGQSLVSGEFDIAV